MQLVVPIVQLGISLTQLAIPFTLLESSLMYHGIIPHRTSCFPPRWLLLLLRWRQLRRRHREYQGQPPLRHLQVRPCHWLFSRSDHIAVLCSVVYVEVVALVAFSFVNGPSQFAHGMGPMQSVAFVSGHMVQSETSPWDPFFLLPGWCSCTLKPDLPGTNKAVCKCAALPPCLVDYKGNPVGDFVCPHKQAM